MATVRLRAPLKRLAGDCAELSVAGATVGELMVALERENPAMDGWILDERGLIRRHINVFVNGEDIRFKDGAKTREVVVEYPIGHRRRRKEGIPVLIDKFRTNLARRFPEKQRAAILDVALDADKLAALPAHEFVDLMVI